MFVFPLASPSVLKVAVLSMCSSLERSEQVGSNATMKNGEEEHEVQPRHCQWQAGHQGEEV